jgi:hypothetical protein
MTNPGLGLSNATAVANAAADAACPDGNDDDFGGVGNDWYAGSSRAGGRRRGISGLSMALAVQLVAAMDSTPRSALRRVAPFLAASTAAIENQSTLWFAALLSFVMATSSGLGGCCPIHRETT